MIEVREYITHAGKAPYSGWLASLDRSVGIRVTARIGRIQNGNFGDSKSVGGGVFELRLDFGPGYRVYFGREGDTLVILLGGGDKDSQSRDIQSAKELWLQYTEQQRS